MLTGNLRWLGHGDHLLQSEAEALLKWTRNLLSDGEAQAGLCSCAGVNCSWATGSGCVLGD